MRRLQFWGLLCLSAALPLLAQAQRDPTVPPFGAEASGGPSPVKPRASAGHWPVLVIDGRPHVAIGTRLYTEGQMLGQARIERITETEVWLREGRALRKVQNYPGVRRNSLPPAQP